METAEPMNGINLKKAIAEKIASTNPSLSKAVVDHFVSEEINRRTNVLIKVMTKFEELMKEKKKLEKPDHIIYDASGQKTEQWSSDRIKQRSQLDEKMGKLNNAIEKALNNADYSQAESLA